MSHLWRIEGESIAQGGHLCTSPPVTAIDAGGRIPADTGGGVQPCVALRGEEWGCRVVLDLCDPCCRETGLSGRLKPVRELKSTETLGETVDRIIREVARESIDRMGGTPREGGA